MSGAGRDGSYGSPNQSPSESQSQIDEAQSLFETMKNEATLRSRRESDAAHTRGPLARGILVLTLVAVVLAVATLVYGISRFPDAPIRATAGGYTGKGGTARTLADFESFVVWERAMLTIFPLAFVLGFAFALVDVRRRRKGVKPQS